MALRRRRLLHPPALASSSPPGSFYRLPRDIAADGSTPADLEAVGLAGNPDPPQVLGPQLSTRSRFTPAGRPGGIRSARPRVGARALSRLPRPARSPGTIRRNVQYPPNGIGVQGFFSWAANEPTMPPKVDLSQLQPPQDEYLVSSYALGLPDPLPTVVSETTKPAPGLEPFRQVPTIQAQPSTGWPTLAPAVPSYGSRIPLRRPRDLVSAGSE